MNRFGMKYGHVFGCVMVIEVKNMWLELNILGD